MPQGLAPQLLARPQPLRPCRRATRGPRPNAPLTLRFPRQTTRPTKGQRLVGPGCWRVGRGSASRRLAATHVDMQVRRANHKTNMPWIFCLCLLACRQAWYPGKYPRTALHDPSGPGGTGGDAHEAAAGSAGGCWALRGGAGRGFAEVGSDAPGAPWSPNRARDKPSVDMCSL